MGENVKAERDGSCSAVMPACFRRASSAFLDSPVKPGNDELYVPMFFILRRLISSRPVDVIMF
jgi:hypothetical protein